LLLSEAPPLSEPLALPEPLAPSEPEEVLLPVELRPLDDDDGEVELVEDVDGLEELEPELNDVLLFVLLLMLVFDVFDAVVLSLVEPDSEPLPEVEPLSEPLPEVLEDVPEVEFVP